MSKSSAHPAASSPFMVSIEELQDRLGRSPYHQWLGLKIVSIDPNGATLSFTLRPDMMGNPETGALHGGIYASIIDATSSCAILARHPGSNLTIDMRVDFHRSVLIEPGKVVRLRAVGTVVRVGRTLGTGDAQVFDAEGHLLASGRGVFMRQNQSKRVAGKPQAGGDVGT
jgi:uncharacterized protein (TIGR00369 family)